MKEAPLPGKRISVHGTSGSGKSTLGKQLANLIGAPSYELDAWAHLPGWQSRPFDEFRDLVEEAITGDSWVIDGNYSKVRDMIWNRADTIVWLDYPLPLILWRLSRRTFGRCLRRELLWGTNRESLFTHLFTKESLFYWVLTTYRRRRKEADSVFASPEYGDKILIRFHSPKQTDSWLASLRSAVPATDASDA